MSAVHRFLLLGYAAHCSAAYLPAAPGRSSAAMSRATNVRMDGEIDVSLRQSSPTLLFHQRRLGSLSAPLLTRVTVVRLLAMAARPGHESGPEVRPDFARASG